MPGVGILKSQGQQTVAQSAIVLEPGYGVPVSPTFAAALAVMMYQQDGKPIVGN